MFESQRIFQDPYQYIRYSSLFYDQQDPSAFPYYVFAEVLDGSQFQTPLPDSISRMGAYYPEINDSAIVRTIAHQFNTDGQLIQTQLGSIVWEDPLELKLPDPALDFLWQLLATQPNLHPSMDACYRSLGRG